MVLAADVLALLERCGLPLDGNGVLANRSRYCRRDVSWDDGVERWATDPAGTVVVMIGLLADAWSVTEAAGGELAAGDRRPGAPPRLRTSMLRDATSVRAGIPSRLLQFDPGRPGWTDLQAAVIGPIVRSRAGVRCRPVRTRCRPDRTLHHAAAQVIDTDDASTLCDCYGRCRASGGAAGRRHGWRRARRRHGVDGRDWHPGTGHDPHRRPRVGAIRRKSSGSPPD